MRTTSFRTACLLSIAVAAGLAAGPETDPAAPPSSAEPAVDAFGYLRAMTARRSADPMGPIADRMGTVAGQLGDLETGAPVQDRQRAVIGDLDAAIKLLESQCKAGTGPGSANPSTPAQRSQITKGPGGSGPLHDPAAGTKEWAKLRPGDRQQITQSQTEGFPPGYEQVLAGYYSRLSQEQVAADAATTPAAGPATRPADR